MRLVTSVLALAFAIVAAGTLAAQARAPRIPKYITAAIADRARPEADTKRDADRKPASVLAFAGVKPGDRVVDIGPGGGYYTRLLSGIAGPHGQVYALNLDWILARFPNSSKPIEEMIASGHYANVKLLVQPMETPSFPEPLDVAFISQIYHDGHGRKLDMSKMNAAIFAALKPGGIYLVLDHVAEAGSGDRDSATLHRIDPALVKAEVTAAGFVFEGESTVLHNPNDPHTEAVFGSLRGKTDQFIYRFHKPKH